MPLWDELTQMSNKAKNMISIRSDVYPETSLSSRMPVSGVPTVLYVTPGGEVQEIEKSRDKVVMKKLLTKPEMPRKMEVNVSNIPNMMEVNVSNIPNMNTAVPKMPPPAANTMNSASASASAPTVPGTLTSPSELTVLPGSKGVSDVVVSEGLEAMVPEQPVASQAGGSLDALVRAAGPAALLLGAYAAFGRTRSSGLPPARRRSRRVRFSRRKRATRRR